MLWLCHLQTVGPGLMSPCYHFPHPGREGMDDSWDRPSAGILGKPQSRAQRLLGLGGLWPRPAGVGREGAAGGSVQPAPGKLSPPPGGAKCQQLGRTMTHTPSQSRPSSLASWESDIPAARTPLAFPPAQGSASGDRLGGQSVPSSPHLVAAFPLEEKMRPFSLLF